MDMEASEFEPSFRARSNTWPLPQTEPPCGQPPSGPAASTGPVDPSKPQLPSSAAKKNSSRRNAWGNLSYADLITQAIASSPDKRLTLSQIYEWMVHNVAYFKDKGDSNSSAGWKNSIRHNLSLHNRFVRVQNEGTGKSSWWMLNPDAKPGKSARRRATSMETSKFEKRRGRVKKKVDALRAGAEPTPSPSSSVSESLDLFPESPLHGFQLSPDFRPRASSNASSTGGRLSPIPASEGEWIPYYSPDQLAGSLEETMRLNQQELRLGQHDPTMRLGHHEPTMRLGQEASGFAYPPPPPPYRPPPYNASHHCSLHRQLLPCPSCATPKHILGSGVLVKTEPEDSQTMMGQLMGALNPHSTTLDDVSLNIEALPLHDGTFDCNVDEVIKHELSFDGSLEFNFGQAAQEPRASDQPFSGHSWVH